MRGVSKPHIEVYTCPVPYCQCQYDSNTKMCVTAFRINEASDDHQCYPPRHGVLCVCVCVCVHTHV